MTGYAYGQDAPVEKCPYCGSWCDADFVDIGVGFVQCGPYHCDQCGASEIGPYDDESRTLIDDERATGWYAPGSEPGSSANVIHGQVVSHQVMKAAYRTEFIGNPLYNVPGEVENWFKEMRNP